MNDKYGAAAWDSIVESAGVGGAYTAVGSYSDADFGRLVTAASTATAIDIDELVRWFGAQSLPLLAARYPEFFEPHSSARSFVLTLNDVIHPEVRKLFPGADAPEFAYDESDPDTLVLSYVSSRGLCSLAEGLVEGAAARFGEKVTIEQRECTKRGDSRCVLACRFTPLAR